ncbi:calcium-binding protein CML37-like [Mangifera indica]|uniref:calcium-binding protein CML37-like n=1 Tax=Mangifera indica TaxID=29780 RepID=UPI001CFABFAE|nr:calcium-binding protein CML37-like [Mangifera indica]
MNSETSFSSNSSMGKKPTPSSSPKKSAFARLRRKLSPKKSDSRSLSVESSSCGELEALFNYFDKNGDGRISAAELQSCLRTVGGELSAAEAEAAIQSSDLDGDGHLDFYEFQKLMENESGNEEQKNSELREAFGMYVMEGSSYITAASLKRMLSRLGEPSSIDDCKAMIRAFDLNGDGVLSFDEFAAMMH